MSQREVSVVVQDVSKIYKLGVIGTTTLREDLQSRWALLRGKEDPNAPIGTTSRYLQNGTLRALNGVSFTAYRGDRLGIIGKNGAGKSTLLKLISRVTSPSEGTIAFNGRVTSMLEVGTGFNGELTGRENIYMNGAILGMNKAEIDRRFDQIVEFSEVGEFIDTPVKRYSSGMYVRLAFSVASHMDADIVIMDEVLAVGDLGFQNKCIKRMSEIAEKDKNTIFYVSHNMDTVRKLCNRCLVMNEGQIIFDGDPEEAIDYYHQMLNIENEQRGTMFERDRDMYAMTEEATLQTVEYLDGHEVDDKLRIRLRYKINKPLEQLCFRMIISNANQRIIGTKHFFDLPCPEVGAEVEHDLVMDVSQFQNSTYLTDYELFYPQNGNYITADRVHGISFTIDDPGRNQPGVWVRRWWGDLSF